MTKLIFEECFESTLNRKWRQYWTACHISVSDEFAETLLYHEVAHYYK